MQEDEGGGSEARQVRRGAFGPTISRQGVRRAAAQGPQRRARAIHDENWHEIGDGSPVTPEMKLAQIVGAHDPDEAHASRSPLQPSDRVPGVTRTDFGLEAGDRDLGSRASRSAASSRACISVRPAADFKGLPGVASDHRRSSRKRCNASSEIRRWPSCGGLKEPPSSPIACPRAKRGRRTKAADDGPGCRNGARAAALSRSLGDIFDSSPVRSASRAWNFAERPADVNSPPDRPAIAPAARRSAHRSPHRGLRPRSGGRANRA